MYGEWILANKCPHCGGRLMLSDFYTFSREYPILKNGRLSKRGRRGAEEGLGIVTVSCDSCHVSWEANHTWINGDGTVEIQGNGEGWSENGCND